VGNPAGLIDVAPSILDFLHVPLPQSFKGRSLLDGAARPAFAESVYARDSFGWSDLRSLRSGQWKYIAAPVPELYDLLHDPRELRNAAAANPAQAETLRTQLGKYAAPAGHALPPADPQRRKEVLQSLGYLAPGLQSNSASRADPKDKLPVLIRYEEALSLMAAKRYDAAILALRAIAMADPGNLLVRRDLGVALIEHQDFREAVTELERVAAAAPDDYITRFELGIACEKTGQPREAAGQFEAALRIAPNAAQAKSALERVHMKITPER
jgi:tetratricopeptide (TPR) repeat protein